MSEAPSPAVSETLDARAERELGPMLEQVQPLSTTPREALVDLAHLVRAVLTFGIPGAIVECGSYAGGAAFLMAHLLREAEVRDRKVWLFDSFEGLPPPQAIDGTEATEYAAHPERADYHDNCRASFAEVQRHAREFGLAAYTECVKGWFEETLPAWRERIGPIALLRVDGNWYASVRCCLDTLYDQVVAGGFVICHTYYQYDGCTVAVNEFLGRRQLPYRIESVTGVRPGEGVEDYVSALFRKGEPSWKWLRHTYGAIRDIEAVVPPGTTFLLADQAELDLVFGGGRRAVPFLEHEGEYGGTPEDDATAIRELERLREAGACFIAFAWPALWWLEYYAGLHQHLRTRYRQIWANERVVVFDLRP